MNKIIIAAIVFFLLTRIVMAFPGEELNLKAEDYFTGEQINLAQNYRVPKYWLFAMETLLSVIFLVLFFLTPLNRSTAEFSNNLANRHMWLAPSVYASYLIILWNIIIFPLHLYTGFIYEHKFSLSNQFLADWIKRYLLAEVLTAAVFIAGVTIFYLLIRK
ncbi:MAG: hypothetical protein ABRQ37_25735, partial [Candidatus Eremiobacterota bacterium]